MSLIFVSYRRQDSQSATGRLCDKLQLHFGADAVFHDIESIEGGANFPATIRSKIDESAVVLAMIGPRWLDLRDAAGRSRLHDPNDYVRLEIAAALERDLPIIPVLVEGARMPSAAVLPDSIAALPSRQAHELSDLRWDYDTDRLVGLLEKYLQPAAPAEPSPVQGPVRALLAIPGDFLELLLQPRRKLAVLLRRRDRMFRALAFFIVAHLAAGWMMMVESYVASPVEFVLTSVPLGASVLGAMTVALHGTARLSRIRAPAPATAVILTYIQSVCVVLLAVGAAVVWAAVEFADPDIGAKIRAIVGQPGAADDIVNRLSAALAPSIGNAVLTGVVIATLVWAFAIGWLLVALGAFRDAWATTWPRTLAAFALCLFVVSVAAGLVLVAATI